jgi:hypothetical protein
MERSRRLDNQQTKNEKIASKVAAIQEKQMTHEQWTAQELAIMASWFK